MISEEVKGFVAQPPLAMCLGTRNAQLKPQVTRAFSAKVSEDGTQITMYISKYFVEACLANLNDNGKVAFTTGSPLTHVSYQFKGQYVGIHDCTEEDYAFMQGNVGAFTEVLEQYYGPDMAATLRNFPLNPSVAITFNVEDVFNQTPGPGAGNKLN